MVFSLLTLLAAAAVIGGGFCLYLAASYQFRTESIASYLRAGAIMGCLASGAFFLTQIGAINQNGLAGMIDPVMGWILAQSGPGHASGMRMMGFLLAVMALAVPNWTARAPAPQKSWNIAALLAWLIASLMLVLAFSLTGHVSTLPLPAKVALSLHVLAALTWMGALYPLLAISKDRDILQVQLLMHHFGRLALFLVGILLASGMFLLTRLLGGANELLFTPYGLTLSLKLVAVSALLALAAANKCFLVPGLQKQQSSRFLQGSIRAELVLGLMVLITTVYLTTAVGPTHR